VLKPNPGASELSVSVADYVHFPPKGAVIEWHRRRSRVNLTKLPDNVRPLSDGRVALVNLRGYRPRTSLTVACVIYNKDGRFFAMRSFSLGLSATTKAENQTTKSSTVVSPALQMISKSWFRGFGRQSTPQPKSSQEPRSTKCGEDYAVINLSVQIDEGSKNKDAEYGNVKNMDDYTIVETNISIFNGGKVKQSGGNVEQVEEKIQSQYRPSLPPPMHHANRYQSNACFQLVHGKDGKHRVIPCSATSPETSLLETSTNAPPRRRQLRRKKAKAHGKPKDVDDDVEGQRIDKDGLQPCRADEDCNLRASCSIHHGTVNGRCVCDPGYLGNGLFCWERFLD
ncbi:unnamed protein product, partial [Ixodes hexagonus]